MRQHPLPRSIRRENEAALATIRTGSCRATFSLSARRKLVAVFASSEGWEEEKKTGEKRREEEEGRRREESGTLGVSSGWSNYPTVSRSRAARAETPGNKTLSFKAEAKPMLSPGPPRF